MRIYQLRLIIAAMYPAPNPLSMFTTATFELQLLSMANSAGCRPPGPLGAAGGDRDHRPAHHPRPRRLGSAPSLWHTTMSTVALSIRSRCWNSL